MVESVQYQRAAVREGKVPISTKTYQGFGGLVNSHKDFAFNTFLLLYYSQILGLSASLVSIVIAISLIIDAISDPIVGSISDNYKSKRGRRHPFMIRAAVPFGIVLGLLFAPPPGLGEAGLFAWLLFFTVSARLAFTFFYVPWSAIGAEFSQDYVERTSIMTFRHLVGWVGGIAFYLIAYTYLFPNSEEYPVGHLNPDAYATFGLAIGVLVIIWALVSSLGTVKEIPYLLQPTRDTPKFSFRRTFDEVVLALQNANFRRLFVVTLLFFGLAGVGGVFDIYMNTYFWEFTPDELRWFAFAGIGAIISFATVPWLQRTIDKHTMLQWFLSIFMLGAMLKVAFRFWDIWPDNGDPILLNLLIVHAIVQTFLLTSCSIMVSSLIADVMDEQELETGRRQEGVFSSALSFSAKATSSVGIVIGGFLLDFVIAFPRQVDVADVDSHTLFLLAFNDGIAIPALFFIPIFLMSRITMTRTRLTEVQAALTERRGHGS